MKSFLAIPLTVLLTSLTPLVDAWGADGHKAVGQIAQNILKSNVERQVAELFQDKSFGGQLAPASLWADTIKKQKGSPFAFWSAPLHFIDTQDNPGKSCSVDEERDCPDGVCVVGAIANYTTQLDCENGFDRDTRDIALRFLTHFFGDITQPLHVCGRSKGGNDVDVTFDGRKTNLHSIWDTQMVQKRLKDFDNSLDKYTAFLTNEIQNGTYVSEKDEWVACDTPSRRRRRLTSAILKRANATTQCSLSWATDTNEINCPFVWESIDKNPNLDLGQGYYKAAIPFVDKQIAKGGYRLGTFLNSILTKKC
ncbi:3104_t:CDS:2 [Funneliformis geosporum]|nr:3104_t:CDS:2 [Funneliformis geosporum]